MQKGKIYYKMGELAEMFDVKHSLIRYWDKEFSILKPDKNGKGNRLFKQKDVETFRLIYHLTKEKGMTIEGAKKYIAQSKIEPVEKDITVIERLQTIKLMLQEVMMHLEEGNGDEKVIFEEKR